jgi:hypothetical protein
LVGEIDPVATLPTSAHSAAMASLPRHHRFAPSLAALVCLWACSEADDAPITGAAMAPDVVSLDLVTAEVDAAVAIDVVDVQPDVPSPVDVSAVVDVPAVVDALPDAATCTGCDDGDPCTSDDCMPNSGCSYSPVPGCVSACGDGVCAGEETVKSCAADCGFLLNRYAGPCATPGSWTGCAEGYVCVARSAAGGGNVCVADFETWDPIGDSHPASDFTEFAEYVTDKKTGLHWAKAWFSVNDTTDLAVCATRTYGGYNDWRLPTEGELLSLVDYSAYDPASSAPNLAWPPAYNPAFYDARFLSGTPAVQTTSVGGSYGWSVNFEYVGEASGHDGPMGWGYIRCVRATGDTVSGTGTRIALNDAGTVFLDRLSGLHWQRQKASASIANWSAAKANCDANAAGLPGTGWRLPTIGELRNLDDRQGSASFADILGQGAKGWSWHWGGWSSTPAWQAKSKDGKCCTWTSSSTAWVFDCAPAGQNYPYSLLSGNLWQCVR